MNYRQHIQMDPLPVSMVLKKRCAFQSSRVPQFSSRNSCKFSMLYVKDPKVIPFPKESSTKCACFGTLINNDGVTATEWVPIVDQVLLMTSIFLTYTAGVIPAKKLLLRSRNDKLNDLAPSGEPSFSGSRIEKDEEVNLKLAWDTVEEKLANALNTIEHDSELESRSVKFKQDHGKRQLSLYAVAEGPRFRLLWSSFQWLRKEAGTVVDISERPAIINMNDWSKVFSEVIQKSYQPLCMSWLEKELCLKSSKPNKVLLSLMVEKLVRDDTILRNIRNSGKEDLYAELTHFLVFGSLSLEVEFT
ncbi:unnamed protein product [Thlaspi arvense]|uniref:ATP synthase protein MI25 n=1 Tax=Thlaspi arvense TaxID=13288 RepID=A0AAU9S3S2_THLAR|nr:unnamed protein product [Thlaspi arvense]